MKTILCDIDGVLADFIFAFRRLAHAHYGVPIYHTWEHPSWDFSDLTPPQLSFLWGEVKRTPGWWYEVPRLSVDTNAVEDLAYNHNVYFCTNRTGDRVKCETEDWLATHFGIQNPTVVLSNRKGEFAKVIGAHLSIEDRAENAWCVAWLSPETTSYLLDRPYNRYALGGPGPSKVIRVTTLEEFLNKCREPHRDAKDHP